MKNSVAVRTSQTNSNQRGQLKLCSELKHSIPVAEDFYKVFLYVENLLLLVILSLNQKDDKQVDLVDSVSINNKVM